MADLRLSAYFASKLFVQIILSIIQSILFIGCFVILFGFVPDNGIITNWTLEMIFIFFSVAFYALSIISFAAPQIPASFPNVAKVNRTLRLAKNARSK